jgi:hypothetical protein
MAERVGRGPKMAGHPGLAMVGRGAGRPVVDLVRNSHSGTVKFGLPATVYTFWHHESAWLGTSPGVGSHIRKAVLQSEERGFEEAITEARQYGGKQEGQHDLNHGLRERCMMQRKDGPGDRERYAMENIKAIADSTQIYEQTPRQTWQGRKVNAKRPHNQKDGC